MRLKVRHETLYTYEQPALSAIQTLRLTPRNHDGQFVARWRVELDAEYRLDRDEDPFGNIMHLFSIGGPIETMRILVEGEVETRDTAGLVQGSAERLPLGLWLRESLLTMPDTALRTFARNAAAPHGEDRLSALHALNQAIFDTMEYLADETDTTTRAAQAFAEGKGVCQDFAQIFVACARSLDIPARYVGGYFLRTDTENQNAGHAWAEAYVPEIGWIGFDPTHGISTTDRYLRIATGIDSLDAAPIRGTRHGGSGEKLTVSVTVAEGRTLVEG